MTREAKIGMLTGLGVIVLIGVLLSEYLGDPRTGAAATPAPGPTGRMADLQVGENFRREQMSPVGVPSMVQPGPHTLQLADGSAIAQPLSLSGPTPPAMFATDPQSQSAQAWATPAAAVPVVGTPAPRNDAMVSDPPMITVADNIRVPVRATNNDAQPMTFTPLGQVPQQPVTVQATPATSVSYTVAAGDSLGKIALKFYNSSKKGDIQKIVAANPAVLKDAQTMLVVGKKLTIPGVAAAPVTPAPSPVYAPGDAGRVGPQTAPALRTVQPPATTYVVQAGDTLEKIARKLAPSKVTEMATKLATVNNIKDPKGLQVGMKLKVPA